MDESVFSQAYDYTIEQSPHSSNRGSVCSDRCIPSRSASNIETGFSLLGENDRKNTTTGEESTRDENSGAYNQLLRSELLGLPLSSQRIDDQSLKTPDKQNLFQFKSEPRNDCANAFSMSPLTFRNQEVLTALKKPARKIAKAPFKVLDAPELQDDFYLNLVDWSSANILAVGLANCVYLWNACTSKVTKLCDLEADDTVTSVNWTARGAHLAVGTNKGDVQIWDTTHTKKLRTMTGHRGRVGAMAWNGCVLSTGSRDHHILHRDVRQQDHFMARLRGHRQEVCGLKWSYDEQQLASGGNDNKLYVWNLRSTTPILKFHEHQAAVKAVAWSPHQHGLLASGGGTADRCIRFWNTANNTPLACVDTGSQVCNLNWSKNVNEIVSTHGYSLNQIILWKYPCMSKMATLTGHTYRVLYLASSPDGQTIATGAGDETLRFWNVFPGRKSRSGSGLSSSLLSMNGTVR